MFFTTGKIQNVALLCLLSATLSSCHHVDNIAQVAEEEVAPGCRTPEHGIIRRGHTYNDPYKLITQTAVECGCICGRDSACKTWSRDRRTGACALKNGIAEARRNPRFDSGVIGGETVGPNVPVDDNCVVHRGVEMTGDGYRSMATGKIDTCCRECEQDLTCTSWTRVRKTGMCLLQRGVPSIIKDRSKDGGSAF